MYFKAEFHNCYSGLDLDTAAPFEIPLTLEHGQHAVARVNPKADESAIPSLTITFEMDVAGDVVAEMLVYYETKAWPEDHDRCTMLIDFFDSKRRFADALGQSVVQTLRWRCGRLVGHPAVFAGLSWSEDNEIWQTFPPRQAQGTFGFRIIREYKADEIAQEVSMLIREGKKWPVAMELYQEARKHGPSAPRSAIVLGIAALEVAVKEHISQIEPTLSWLVSYLPAPPMRRILGEYLPQLSYWSPRPPRSVLSMIDAGIKVRDGIVQRGEDVGLEVDVSGVLTAVEDVIWLLQWCGGLRRAWSFISGNTQLEYLNEQLADAVEVNDLLSRKEKTRILAFIPDLLRPTSRTESAILQVGELKEKLGERTISILKTSSVGAVREKLGGG